MEISSYAQPFPTVRRQKIIVAITVKTIPESARVRVNKKKNREKEKKFASHSIWNNRTGYIHWYEQWAHKRFQLQKCHFRLNSSTNQQSATTSFRQFCVTVEIVIIIIWCVCSPVFLLLLLHLLLSPSTVLVLSRGKTSSATGGNDLHKQIKHSEDNVYRIILLGTISPSFIIVRVNW